MTLEMKATATTMSNGDKTTLESHDDSSTDTDSKLLADEEYSHGSSDYEDDDDEIDETSAISGKQANRQTLKDLERQCESLQNLLYEEKIGLIATKLQKLNEGTNKEYLTHVAGLESTKDREIKTLQKKLKFRMKCIQKEGEAKASAIQENFEFGKKEAYDWYDTTIAKYQLELEQRKKGKKLDGVREAEGNVSLDLQGRVRKPDANPSLEVMGPCIVYQLKDSEICDDYLAIKEASLKRIMLPM